MRVIRWRKSKVIKLTIAAVAIIILLVGAFVLQNQQGATRCSNEESRAMLKDVCTLYSQGSVAGNLCHDLCSAGRLRFKKCLNYREGKKILYMDWRQWPVILKSEKAYFKDYFRKHYADFAENVIGMNGSATLDQMIKKTIQFDLGYGKDIENATDILSDMWSLHFDDYVKNSGIKNSLTTAINSLWSLMQQEEYVTMKFYPDYEHFPRIYGSCGHFYAMEYAPPGEYLGTSISQNLVSGVHWNERAKIALGILDLVRSFEMDLHQPLHMCDLKGENFGLNPELVVKAIDTDMVFFEPKLFIEFKHTNCTKNSDCDFFDCRGWCFVDTGQCAPRRTNNNLQVVCEQIFLPYNSNSWLGLLRAPPKLIKERLFRFLNMCAHPQNTFIPEEQNKASETSFWRIHTLLKQSIDFEIDHEDI